MMNSDRLNRWLTLAANIGVFLGLVLVAYEINQSAINLELAVSSDGSDNFQQAMEVLVQDEDLATLIYKAESSYETLDEFETWRVSKYLDGFFTMSEQDFRVLATLSGGDAAVGFEEDWRENMVLPMYKDYWSHSEERFTPEFRRFINEILNESQGR
jgi:hypothetical protein